MAERLDKGPQEVVEIALDRPVLTDVGTRFIFNDGQPYNEVSYVYAPQAPLPPCDADLDLDVSGGFDASDVPALAE